jgi:ribosomal protein L11 methyltransferase
MTAWLQLTLEVPPEEAPRYDEWLTAAGAAAVSLEDAADQPLYEPAPGETPLWYRTRVTGLFEADMDMDEVLDRLRAAAGSEPPAHRVEPLEDRDWTRAWLEGYQPLRLGERLWVCPEGFDVPPPPAVTVRLDPGLAFGTGTHPTTALCLEWLDAHPPTDRTVMDYGSGSGILAIAAALLGARRVTAIDNDPQALIATRDNAARNGVSSRIATFGPQGCPAEPHAVVLANILAGPLIALAPRLARLVRPGGWLILSGILEDQAAQVAGAYAPWLALEPPTVRDGWVRLDGRRRAAAPGA